MLDISVLIPGCNPDLLYTQLTAGGYADASIMTPTVDPANPWQVTVHLLDGSNQSVIDAAKAIIHAHDPTQLSPSQQTATAQQQQQLTLKGELTALSTLLRNFDGDTKTLASNLAVLVDAISGLV